MKFAAAFFLLTAMVGVWASASSARNFPDHLHIEDGVTAEFTIILGLAMCAYGFRLLYVMTFVSGFLITGILTAMAFEGAFGSEKWVLAASWIGFVVVGFAGGCVALAFFPLGVFLVGCLLTYAFTASFPYRLVVGESDMALNAVIALLGGILAWLLVCPLVIIATSLVGSTAVIWGVGFFAGKYPSHRQLERFHSRMAESDRAWVSEIPVVWWVYLACVMALFIFGVAKQFHDVRKARNGSRIGRLRSSTSVSFP